MPGYIPGHARLPKRPGATPPRLWLEKVGSFSEVDASASFPFFDDKGNAVFSCHPENEREQDSVVDRYVESIAEYGLNADVRGKCFVLESGTTGKQRFPLMCITWGTLMRAAYRAFDEQPQSSEVKSSKIDGLSDVCVLSSRTPRDVVQWVRDFHNSWHFGSSCTFVQLFREVVEIQANWQGSCEIGGQMAGDPVEHRLDTFVRAGFTERV
jgi:hypothetical protein